MIALPLLWGQALAWVITGQFSWHWFVVILFYGALYQVYILYLNDYADEAIDRLNTTYWLSGGSRVIPDGQLSGQQLRRAAFWAFALLILIAAYCVYMSRTGMVLLCLLALLAGWSYSLRPPALSYRGYGELLQGATCGGLLPVTAFYLQAGDLLDVPWLALSPLGLLFYAGNIVTALPDTPSDGQGGKRTYPVRRGEKQARRDAILLLLAAYLSVPIVSAPWIAPWVAGLFVSAPAISILGYVWRCGALRDGDAENRQACKLFVLLTTCSQVWMIVAWTALLFLQAASQHS